MGVDELNVRGGKWAVGYQKCNLGSQGDYEDQTECQDFAANVRKASDLKGYAECVILCYQSSMR